MRFIRTCFLIYFTICFACKAKKNINFVPLHQFDNNSKIDDGAGKILLIKSRVYIVKNHIPEYESKIDSFAYSLVTPAIDTVDSFQLIFYKASSKTNEEYLKNNPRSLVRYSQDNDLICYYSWGKGRFMSKVSYVDGCAVIVK